MFGEDCRIWGLPAIFLQFPLISTETIADHPMSINLSNASSWEKRARILIQALIVSGSVNIGLLATFFYTALQKEKESVTFEKAPESLVQAFSNGEILASYASLSFKELLQLLENEETVEEGYKKRDLALGCLTAFHFFNLEKALGSLPVQQRTLSFIHKEGQERVHVSVFPALSQQQYEAIIFYAQRERWPLTSQGLFFELQNAALPKDPSLLEAFSLTAEFEAVKALFTHGGLPLPSSMILEVVCESQWEDIDRFVKEQKVAQDLSATRLKFFLFDCIRARSLMAAKILVQWDREFIIKKFEDVDLFLILDLLKENTASVELFLKELLRSPRSDGIWKRSAEKLFTFHHLPFTEPYDHAKTLALFFPEEIKKETTLEKREVLTVHKPEVSKFLSKKYIVQEGDNLWKIARKHKVSIEKLKKINHLETDKLRPGKELEIP